MINIDSTDELYLRLLVKRLYLQASYNDKFGNRGYQRMLEESDLEERQKQQDDKADLMNEIANVNSSMMSRVRDNYESGRVQATNPMKETIFSGAGVSKKSRTVRPLDDREGGLILPPGYGD